MSEPGPAKATSSEQPEKTFNILFFRAPFFRTIQADGAWGRISPANSIHLSLFNDCGPLPAVAHHKIGADGKLSGGMSLSIQPGTDLIRQVEVDVVLSLESAKAVRDTLENFIKILEDMKKSSQP
jgi:hypothetical protein